MTIIAMEKSMTLLPALADKSATEEPAAHVASHPIPNAPFFSASVAVMLHAHHVVAVGSATVQKKASSDIVPEVVAVDAKDT
jgi:hypothetical protein